MPTIHSYDQDFYAWLMHNANLIRQGRFAEMDALQVAEELESMGKRDKRELMSRFKILLLHLLKRSFQSEKRSRSWEQTIDEQREQINLILADSPSLKYQLIEKINDTYPLALKAAMKETNLPPETFPTTCPYSLEQLLAETFYPDNGF
jgi:hypothetical protein